MDDLVIWLRAQFDEEARMLASLDSTARNGIEFEAGSEVLAYVERGLAEVDARRRILDAYASASSAEESEYDGGYTVGLLMALRLLALPRADRPGYRDEWKP